MHIRNNYIVRERVSLKACNSFGLEVSAAYYAEITHPDEFLKLMDTGVYQTGPRFILGGGSNVLFSDDYQGLIIRNNIPGISLIAEDEQTVRVRTGAGVVWDDLVRHTIEKGWGGLENLSMIPGLTGAAPIQNIGAYGVELDQVFYSLDALSLETGRQRQFHREECRFGYRDSIFKSGQKDQWLITSVTLTLNKKPKINTDFGNLVAVLSGWGIRKPDIRDISRAVRHIRSTKLPDPATTGNAGSFFKNPIVPDSRYSELQKMYPDLPGYPSGSSQMKIPAAWLIDHCGYKGFRSGDAGIHEHHALIIVNYGNATGRQLIDLAKQIQYSVFQTFGIQLEPEVNIIGPK
ncbi:UDP-N-acetylmuramate dehydrogenase [Balneolales bacterium ANBcel1]|nr:UDP-N-acetylmuramate dehydrogenase [Balneolales bacterium ANBcel1]